MREDLNKQLCERARHHHDSHYGESRRNRHLDEKLNDMYEDDVPAATFASGGAREGMKRRYHWDWTQKSFNEHLSPLYGNIRKAVGRKWDDFYSELKTNFDVRSVINQHIIEHLYDRIAVNEVSVDDDGELMVKRAYSQQREPLRGSQFEFFVDPRDGIIKINKHYKTWKQERRESKLRDKAAEEAVRRVVDDLTELRKINDVWFEVKFTEYEPTTTYKPVHAKYSMFGAKQPHTYTRVHYDLPLMFDILQQKTVQQARVATSKRTLSHKELKKHGLI